MEVLTHDIDEARRLVTQMYLPHRLDLGRDTSPVALRLAGSRLGKVTVGRIAYGRRVRFVSEESTNLHVNVALRGKALSDDRSHAPVVLAPGAAAVFEPGVRGEITTSPDCAQLCLMLPKATVTDALERMLGESLRHPLLFDFGMDLRSGPGRSWWRALRLALDEVDGPDAAGGHPVPDRHVEAVLLDGLLLGQRHSYTAALQRRRHPASGTTVRRAVELLEDRPGEPWTTVGLATVLHVSVRSLQERFQAELGVPPMTYLRRVRLGRVREALEHATADEASVRQLATAAGFRHQGRFAALYKDAYGELPSATLDRVRE